MTTTEAQIKQLKIAKKLTVKIVPDHDIENPSDWDHNWRVISFSNRHINYEPADRHLDPIPLALRNKLRAGTAFILSYYEHSGSAWSLQGEGMQCNWDTTRCAGLLIWDHKITDMGARTPADRAKDARAFLEVYNAWANGHGHGYEIIDSDTDETLESCYGFYDCDSADTFEDIRAQLDCMRMEYGEIEISNDPDSLFEFPC